MAKPLKVHVFGRKIWPVAFQGCSICCQNLSPDDSPARKKELVLKIGRAGCETGRESFLFSILLLERFSSEQQIKFRGSFPALTSFGGLGGVRFMVGLDLKDLFQPICLDNSLKVLHLLVVFRTSVWAVLWVTEIWKARTQQLCQYQYCVFPLFTEGLIWTVTILWISRWVFHLLCELWIHYID